MIYRFTKTNENRSDVSSAPAVSHYLLVRSVTNLVKSIIRNTKNHTKSIFYKSSNDVVW